MKLSCFTINVFDKRFYGEHVKNAFTIYEISNGDIVPSDLIFKYIFLEFEFAKLRIFEKKEKFKLDDYKWKQK
jgi:hypothetical protein